MKCYHETQLELTVKKVEWACIRDARAIYVHLVVFRVRERGRKHRVTHGLRRL